MDIVKEVKERFGKMPAAISYKDLCEILDAGEALTKTEDKSQNLTNLQNTL